MPAFSDKLFEAFNGRPPTEEDRAESAAWVAEQEAKAKRDCALATNLLNHLFYLDFDVDDKGEGWVRGLDQPKFYVHMDGDGHISLMVIKEADYGEAICDKFFHLIGSCVWHKVPYSILDYDTLD